MKNITVSINVSRSAMAAMLAGALLVVPAAAVFAQDSGTATVTTALSQPVGSALEVHISNKGVVEVHGAKITAISGSTITASTLWGSSTLTWTVNTNANTKLWRRYDGTATLAEMSVGDYVNFSGSLDQSQSGLVVTATLVRDSSIQKAHATFTGTVQSIAASSSSFMLTSKERGVITVTTVGSTTITKDGIAIGLGSIAVGDSLTASGLYDNNSKVLAASSIVVKIPAILQKHTFEGKLSSAIGTTSLPTSFQLTVGNTSYTVKVAAGTAVLSKNWASTNLATYQAGDSIRVYGSVESGNLSMLDAVVIRNATH